MMLTDELKLAVAHAIQNEWGIDPWGRLSYQAELALKTDAKQAIMVMAEEVLDAVVLPYLEARENEREREESMRAPYPEV